ncbi:MAG: glycoside hydrolase 43 family protein [Gemmatimonadaceae bacterium]
MSPRLRALLAAFLALTVVPTAGAQRWRPDLGDGRYRNPVLFADYSDPDVIRVGDDFYLTASSFGHVPALPILHSSDLVNWRIINHAERRLPPAFDVPQHGNGVWAPALRYHDGEFYLYYGDPDRGIYVVKTRDIRGAWDPPVLVKAARGWIDPCPLWDDDGNAYLVHAFANSRAGIKSVLHVAKLSADGMRVLDDGRLVFDGHETHPTIEGPKFYKRNGWYYIFAPAGGVSTGWQTVLRSRSVYGPYEARVVMHQGAGPINGPHQGGWVELANGEDWFMHFQDRGPFGRVVHLQPMRWRPDGWPVIGDDSDNDGTGEPVLTYRKPAVRRASPRREPQTSDEFDADSLGPQWQWQGNDRPAWYSLGAHRGRLLLYAQPVAADSAGLYEVPSLLLQKLSAPALSAETRVRLGSTADQTAGLIVFGTDYAYVALRRSAGRVELLQVRNVGADKGAQEAVVARVPVVRGDARLRVAIDSLARCRFAYTLDGRRWHEIGDTFQARPGRWVGAKIGVFAVRPHHADAAISTAPVADFDFFHLR